MSLHCSLHLTCFKSVGIAVEEIEQHEPSEVDWIPQQTSHQSPHLWRGKKDTEDREEKESP